MSNLTTLNNTMSRNPPPIVGPSNLSLNLLIHYMDNVLSAITNKDELDSGIKLRDLVQPLSSDLSKLFEGISQGAKMLSDQKFLTSKLSTEAQTVALDVLRGVGNAHWISANDRECIDLLKAMLSLAKYMKQLKDNSFDLHGEILEKMCEAVQLIVRGAILCHSFITSNKISKFLLTTKIRKELVYVRGKVDTMKSDLGLQMQFLIMSTLTSYISRNLHTGGMDETNFLVVTEMSSQQSNDIHGEMEQTYKTDISGSESETGSPSIQDNFDEINGYQPPEMEPRTDFRNMQKMVLKLLLKDEKSKRKALKVLEGVSGVDYVTVNMKESMVTVVGVADPVYVTAKLRKGFGYTELLAVGKKFKEVSAKKNFSTVFIKIVFKFSIEDEKSQRKAIRVVAGVSGVDSVALDMKESRITVVGNVDPVFVAAKLRKIGFGYTELLTLGPAKEEKKEDEEERGKNPELPRVVYMPGAYEYSLVSDENPNACTIC